MLFPLGTSCKVRESIQRYLNYHSLETNIFDWVFTNFASILYFLNNIDIPITENDFYDTKIITNNHRYIFHKKIRFESIHDFSIHNNYDFEMQLLLEKYNRRLQRLKKYIIGDEKLDFIHLIDTTYNIDFPDKQLYIPTVKEIDEFFNAIHIINPTCTFNLHLLFPPTNCKFFKFNFIYDKNKIDELKINERIFIHYLEQDETIDPVLHQCRHWSWNSIYSSL